MTPLSKMLIAAITLSTATAQEHSLSPALEFEVAAVKPAAGIGGSSFKGGPGTARPGELLAQNISLDVLLKIAYDLKDYQMKYPRWFESQRYDVTAKVPSGITRAEFLLMLQNLLTERFQMAIHREKRPALAYSLSVLKGGPKFSLSDESRPLPAVGSAEAVQAKLNALGALGPDGMIHVSAKGQSMNQLAEMLSKRLHADVVDSTNLKGRYDFSFYMMQDQLQGVTATEPGASVADSGPTLFTALRQQLGLALQSVKSSVEVLVVDTASKVPLSN